MTKKQADPHNASFTIMASLLLIDARVILLSADPWDIFASRTYTVKQGYLVSKWEPWTIKVWADMHLT